jgi:hypothetical protein
VARYATTGLSQAAQLAGVNSGTTVNGYLGYWGASATSGFRVRRFNAGVIAGGSVPTSQQISIGIYRQTVAPAGTGLAAAVLGIALETWTPQTDPTVGLIMTTAATIGTTAPTLGANALYTIPFNTQSNQEEWWEAPNDFICTLGTANGIAFVNIGNTLPASHSIRLNLEIEV